MTDTPHVPAQAVVLAAGLGTRLRPLTSVRAKAAVPVGGQPLIGRIARWLASHRVSSLVVNLHALPMSITGALGDGRDLGVRIRYSWEGERVLGSGGGPRAALPLLDPGPFLIVNGDTLTDLDLADLSAAHFAGDALVTLALVPNLHPERYGGISLDAHGAVTGFPRRGPSAVGSFHFIGVQMASPEAFLSIQTGTVAATIGGLYDELIATRPGSIRGVVSTARFWDIGTVADYWQTSIALARETTGAPAGRQRPEGLLGVGRATVISPDAQVRRSILWDDVVVEPGCDVEDCIVTDAVRITSGARYRRAILWRTQGRVAVTSFDEVGVPA